MSLSWSTPNTASAGGVISAYAYNTYVRDNLNYLLQRPSAQIIYAGTSDRLTSSGNWDVIDATNLTLNLTLANTRALIMATFWATVDNTSGNYGAFDILRDGTTRIGGTNGLVRFPLSVGSNLVTLIGYAINMPLGAHTFQIVAKSSVAGINTTVFNNGVPITLTGFEV